MVYSPQDVYGRHLVSGRGYPLWTPEPNMNLPDVYVREGLKIGDVGVVVPEDGSFDVFFNVCLPPTHSLHRETGVPNNFTPIQLSSRDITKYPEAESAGRIISTSSVTRVRNTNESDEDLARRAQPGPLNYEFTLSSQEGAVLILPEGAERYYLRNERLFLDQSIQHAVDWYTFAEQRLGRIISHDSLYLITGFYKARSWSLAAYQQGAGRGEASAQFKALQVGRGNIAANYTWETTGTMDWRAGPSDQYYNGIPNQTVFIQGFKIAIREGILGTKWVNVKADFPSARPYRVEFSSGSWFSSLWGGGSGSTANAPKRTGTNVNMDATERNLPVDEGDGAREDITIHRFPHVTKPFHPSDIINQHLLREVPSATVAVTHDSQWTTLLERGVLEPGELPQEDRLIAGVTSNYSAVLAYEVYLKSIAIKNDTDDDTIAVPIFSEEDPELSSIPPDTPTLQLSDPGLPAANDPSAKPYTCAYGSIPFTNPESSHAMYRTAHELQEHVTVAHPDIVGTHIPVFRCGLAGCGLSLKHIQELEYHIQLVHSSESTEEEFHRMETRALEDEFELEKLDSITPGAWNEPTGAAAWETTSASGWDNKVLDPEDHWKQDQETTKPILCNAHGIICKKGICAEYAKQLRLVKQAKEVEQRKTTADVDKGRRGGRAKGRSADMKNDKNTPLYSQYAPVKTNWRGVPRAIVPADTVKRRETTEVVFDDGWGHF
ncbi:hypothetical protein J3R83DRAFT_2522 [Lanmaoa asiatica]|nr:hypothetical protein J3R83DRAFT_2522 [Lanmaoa asiatica]